MSLEKLKEFISNQENEKLPINEKDLNSSFMQQPSGFLQVSIRYESSERLASMQKNEYEKLRAEKGQQIRKSIGKTTEKAIEEFLNADDDVIRAKNILINAQYQAGCYKQLMRAWEHRRDMLIQLGSNWRSQFNADVQINNSSTKMSAKAKERYPMFD